MPGTLLREMYQFSAGAEEGSLVDTRFSHQMLRLLHYSLRKSCGRHIAGRFALNPIEKRVLPPFCKTVAVQGASGPQEGQEDQEEVLCGCGLVDEAEKADHDSSTIMVIWLDKEA